MSLEVNLDLVKKYSKPGPRYTSYPTAPHFSTEFTDSDWVKEIKLNNKNADRPLSFYFHIPFCHSLCYYCGCTTTITRDYKQSQTYLEYLIREMELIKPLLHSQREIVQLHWGGGSPSYLQPEDILKLSDEISRRFSFSKNAELGVELDPRRLTLEHIQAFRQAGFNRASLGIQDFDPAVQKAVNRINPLEMVQEAVKWIRENGFQSLNLDLIFGLPLQTPDSFQKTLEASLKLNPDRFAIFNFAWVPWMKPHQKLIRETDLPTPEIKLAMLKMIVETLTAAGYVYIGMDHFAKKDDELTLAQKNKTLQRNFQGYSTWAGTDIYGFGMSAISQTEWAYSQNLKETQQYYKRLDAERFPVKRGLRLTDEDQLRRQIITHLMCNLELDFSVMDTQLGESFSRRFQNELNRLPEFADDGLLEILPDKIIITEAGRLFIRNIAMVFDAYLKNNEQRFSKTI
jgi:oxygen-independent coproporphyrinogen III oxidase